MSAHVVSFVAAHSVAAVFVLMAVDAVFPAASELVMLTAGALAVGAFGHGVTVFGASVATGAPAFAVLVAAGTLGYLAGALVGWAIGVRGGRALLARRGRWLHLGPDRLERAERWFARFGPSAVFVGRIVPVARSFVSIPAGVLGFPIGRYTALTFAGSLVWCAAFAGAGAAVGANYERVHRTIGHVEVLAGALVVVAGVVLVVRSRARRSRNPPHRDDDHETAAAAALFGPTAREPPLTLRGAAGAGPGPTVPQGAPVRRSRVAPTRRR